MGYLGHIGHTTLEQGPLNLHMHTAFRSFQESGGEYTLIVDRYFEYGLEIVLHSL